VNVARDGPKSCPTSLRNSGTSSTDYR
jgi:hypothetical protein